MMRPGELSPPLGDLAGLQIHASEFIPRGRYYTTGPALDRLSVVDGALGDRGVILCHPDQVVRLEAGLEAIGIVRAGMADVLEWLGDAYPPKPEPRNRPLPARHLARMVERLAAMCGAGARGERVES